MEPGGPRPKPRIRLPPTKKPVMLISLILIKMILVKDGDGDSFDAFGHDQMLIHLIQIKVMRAMKKMMMKKKPFCPAKCFSTAKVIFIKILILSSNFIISIMRNLLRVLQVASFAALCCACSGTKPGTQLRR